MVIEFDSMLLINYQDLEARGIECQEGSELVFINTRFQKGQTFAHDQRKVAISSCRQLLDAGFMSLIINYQDSLTLWIETDVTSSPPNLQVQTANDVESHSSVKTLLNSSWSYQQMLTKLNEPVEMKTVIAKLQDLINFKSIFSKGLAS